MRSWRILPAAIAVLALSFTGKSQDLASAAEFNETERIAHEAEKVFRAGELDRALGLFGEVLVRDPENVNAFLQRGAIHSMRKEYEAAITDFTRVIEHKPDHLWAYTSRGSAYNKLGKYDLAMSDFDLVLGMDPRNQEAFNDRGWSKKALGDSDGACRDWRASKRMGNEEAAIILKNNRCK